MAGKLAEIIEDLVENTDETLAFIDAHGDEIEWE